MIGFDISGSKGMSIFKINKNVFAIGKAGKRAAYVVALKRGKLVGVRGQRPVLDDRFNVTRANKAIRAALTEAIA